MTQEKQSSFSLFVRCMCLIVSILIKEIPLQILSVTIIFLEEQNINCYDFFRRIKRTLIQLVKLLWLPSRLVERVPAFHLVHKLEYWFSFQSAKKVRCNCSYKPRDFSTCDGPNLKNVYISLLTMICISGEDPNIDQLVGPKFVITDDSIETVRCFIQHEPKFSLKLMEVEMDTFKTPIYYIFTELGLTRGARLFGKRIQHLKDINKEVKKDEN